MITINVRYRSLSAALLLGFLLCSVHPALALRPSGAEHPEVRSGLEEGIQAGSPAPTPFVPWEGAPERVLVRPGPRRPSRITSPEIAEYLHGRLMPLVRKHLRSAYGMDEIPLVRLGTISDRLGIPVYLFRSGLTQTGSAKIYMISAILSLFLDGDPYRLFGEPGAPLPEYLVTQSTGNHGLALCVAARMLEEIAEEIEEAGGRPGFEPPKVVIFAGTGIPPEKKALAQELGAELVTDFADYGEARLALERYVETMWREGKRALYVSHGDRAVIAANSAAALELERAILTIPGGRDQPVVVLLATGAGGHLAGARHLADRMPNVRMIGSETPRIAPVFEAVRQGKPVEIRLPEGDEVIVVDGIAVDRVEPEALPEILGGVDAIALVPDEQVPSWSRWTMQDLAAEALESGLPPETARTEGVTGMSVAVPFLYPKLMEVDGKRPAAIVIEETGRNVGAASLEKIRLAPLPPHAAATPPADVSLEPMSEKIVEDHWERLTQILNEIPPWRGEPRSTSRLAPGERDERFSFVAREKIRGPDGTTGAGPVVGLVVGRPAEGERDRDAVAVVWLGIHRAGEQDWRRRGIGRRLMERVFSAAREAGYPRVIWHVADANREAIAFYEGLKGVRSVAILPPASPGAEPMRRYEVLLRARAGLEEGDEVAGGTPPGYGRGPFLDTNGYEQWATYRPDMSYPDLLAKAVQGGQGFQAEIMKPAKGPEGKPFARKEEGRIESLDRLWAVRWQGDGLVIQGRLADDAPYTGPLLQVEEGVRFEGGDFRRFLTVRKGGVLEMGDLPVELTAADLHTVVFEWEDEEYDVPLIRDLHYDAEGRFLILDLHPRILPLPRSRFLPLEVPEDKRETWRGTALQIRRVVRSERVEPAFPPPVESDREPAPEIHPEEGYVYPAAPSPLAPVGFISPVWSSGVSLYAELPNLGGRTPDTFRRALQVIQDRRTGHLYDTPGPEADRVRRLVETQLGRDVIAMEARIQQPEKGDLLLPMVPINVWEGERGGTVRFQGWVPAEERLAGPHRVTFEVRVGLDAGWRRLKEESGFWIYRAPREDVGPVRIPEMQKSKLGLTASGDPVVIGWGMAEEQKGQFELKRPVAAEELWFRSWGGRTYLLGAEEMRRYGFPFAPDRPDIWKGEPLLEAWMSPDFPGVAVLPSIHLFDDERLHPRLERWRRQEPWTGLPAPGVGRAGAVPPADLMSALDGVNTADGLLGFLTRFSGPELGRAEEGLHHLTPEQRDAVLHGIHGAFDRWAQPDPAAPLARIVDPPLPAPATPSPSATPVVGVVLNPVLDLLARAGKGAPAGQATGRMSGGGGPLKVVAAMRQLGLGGPVDVVALGVGPSGDRLFRHLQRTGFREGENLIPVRVEPRSGAVGQTRASFNGALSSTPRIPKADLDRALDQAWNTIQERGPRGILVIGERLIEVESSEGAAVADALAGLVRRAKGRRWLTAVSCSSSWDRETLAAILEASPEIVHTELALLARMAERDPAELLLRWEEVADLADGIRQAFGARQFLVSLGKAGEILVADQGWYRAVPSPVLELSYVTGERDVVLSAFLQMSLNGVPLELALRDAVVAGILHMESWGEPVSAAQIETHRSRADVYPMLQPVRPVRIIPVQALPDEALLEKASKELRDSPGRPEGVYFWLDRPAPNRRPLTRLTGHPGLSILRGTPEQVAQLFAGMGRRLRVVADDPAASQLRPHFESLQISVEARAGLEESRVLARKRVEQRMRQMSEGRSSKGLLVVQAGQLRRFEPLAYLLGRLPADLASSVILWRDDPNLEPDVARIADENPALGVFRGRDIGPLAFHLVEQTVTEGADGIALLGERGIADRLNRDYGELLGVTVRQMPWSISLILQAMGIPGEVLEQVDLEGLLEDLFTMESA